MWRCWPRSERGWQNRTPYNEIYYLMMLQKRRSKPSLTTRRYCLRQLLKLIAEPAKKAA